MCLNKRRVDCCKGCSYFNELSCMREMYDDFMFEGEISEGRYLKEMNQMKEQWDKCTKVHNRVGCTDHHSDINDDINDDSDLVIYDSSDDEGEEIVVRPFEWRGIQYYRDDEGNLYNYYYDDERVETVGRVLNGLVTIF